MTKEELLVEEIRVEISKLPEAQALRVFAIAQTLRNILNAEPQNAPMALALVGAEMAAVV